MGQLTRKRKRGSTGATDADTPSTMSSTQRTTPPALRTTNGNTSDVETVRTDNDGPNHRMSSATNLSIDVTLDKSQSQTQHLVIDSQPNVDSDDSVDEILSQRAPPEPIPQPMDQDMDPMDDNEEDMDMSNRWGDDYEGPSFSGPTETQVHRKVNEHTAEAEQRAKLNVAECGAIESITLQNFMCHSNFYMDFGPRINFIVGRNGSGKSAILTAVVLGLGGRAATTSRGKGIASFIKSGESQAKIILKICNSNDALGGKRGYNADQYGKSIIIERTINASGASSYKLKSAAGKLVADRKEQLDSMIRYFNIQVDNPICVLNQEVSRNFLNTKNSRDKYTFFMKATLLEDVKNDYAASETHRTISQKILDQKKAVIPDTTRDLKELERKVKMFNDLENHKERFARLNGEALWALVNEQKAAFEDVRAQVVVFEKRVETQLRKVDEEKAAIAQLDTDKTDTMARMNSLLEDVNQTNDALEELKTQVNDIKEKIRTKERDERSVTTERNVTTNDIKNIEKKIKGYEQQFSNESHNRRKADISSLKEEMDGLKAEEQTLLQQFQELDQSMQALADKGLAMTQERNGLGGAIAGKQRDIQRLNQSREDQLKKFGPKYPELVKRIDEAHRRGVFKQKPLGPIGNHIKLKDYSCALAVELCLKGLIYAFCCDNMDDKRQLDDIIKRVFGEQRKPPIVTRPFGRRHDVSQHCVRSADYKSLFELMEMKEDAIANCVIDQCRVEQILYIPDYTAAEELLMSRETSPMNCYQAYTSDGCVMFPQTRGSDYKSYANRNKRNANILMKNVDQMVDQLMKEVNEMNERLQKSEQTLQSHRQAMDNKKREMNELDKRKKQIRTETINKDRKLKELESIGDSPPVEISTLEEELQTFGAKLSELEERRKVVQEELEALKVEYQGLDAQMTTKKQEKDDLLDSRPPLKSRLEAIKTKIANHTLALKEYERKMADTEALKTAEEEKMAVREQEFENGKQEAMKQTGEEMRTRRSSKTVVNEIKQLQKFLDQQESSIGQKDQIYRQYKELSTHYKRIKTEVNDTERHLRHLKKSLDLRRRGYVELRNFYSMMTKIFFLDILKHKGFCGSLDIYHTQREVNGELKKSKTLEIKVNPKSMDDSQARSSQMSTTGSYSDTRSLSGGERSYSTVAFILALWESAQSPFKILDEVDVFMDLMTRKISLDTMIEFASQKSGKQYIFLSPLKLQNLSNQELIRVFQMPEPKRIDG